MTTLAQLNAFSANEAHEWFMQTCSASKWCSLMATSRPFKSIPMLERAAYSHWQTMQSHDLFEAFDGHPMIGDLGSLRAKYKSTKAIASTEQSGTVLADDATLMALQKANQDYLKKHGFIFIICATGLSANTMLHELLNRIENPSDTEIAKAAQEQIKITLLRIHMALNVEDTHHE